MEDRKKTPNGHGPHAMVAEKPKNFSESMKKLFTKLQEFKKGIIVALVLALL